MDYFTAHIGTVIGLVLVVYWRSTRNSSSRKSPEQRKRESVPTVVQIEGRVLETTGLPHLRRRNDCKIRFTATCAEIYRPNIYRTDTFAGMVPYSAIRAIGWRNQYARQSRTSVVVGQQVGHTFVGAANRLPQSPPKGYITFGLDCGARSLVVECPGRLDGVLRERLLPAIRATGANPVIEIYEH